jgi:hypothetical protein
MTKTLPPSKQETLSIKSEITPTPTPNNEYFLTIENPKDEAVVNSKSVTISGKTSPNATIIVSTATNDQVVTPAENGNFTLNDTIGNGTNLIQITAVFPTGEEKTETRTVVYTTESF